MDFLGRNLVYRGSVGLGLFYIIKTLDFYFEGPVDPLGTMDWRGCVGEGGAASRSGMYHFNRFFLESLWYLSRGGVLGYWGIMVKNQNVCLPIPPPPGLGSHSIAPVFSKLKRENCCACPTLVGLHGPPLCKEEGLFMKASWRVRVILYSLHHVNESTCGSIYTVMIVFLSNPTPSQQSRLPGMRGDALKLGWVYIYPLISHTWQLLPCVIYKEMNMYLSKSRFEAAIVAVQWRGDALCY